MKEIAEKTILCPSARPEPGESFVFGIIGGTVAEPRVAYLKQPQPITDELIAKVSPVTPAEVFRTASTCATNGCQHFDGKNCGIHLWTCHVRFFGIVFQTPFITRPGMLVFPMYAKSSLKTYID